MSGTCVLNLKLPNSVFSQFNKKHFDEVKEEQLNEGKSGTEPVGGTATILLHTKFWFNRDRSKDTLDESSLIKTPISIFGKPAFISISGLDQNVKRSKPDFKRKFRVRLHSVERPVDLIENGDQKQTVQSSLPFKELQRSLLVGPDVLAYRKEELLNSFKKYFRSTQGSDISAHEVMQVKRVLNKLFSRMSELKLIVDDQESYMSKINIFMNSLDDSIRKLFADPNESYSMTSSEADFGDDTSCSGLEDMSRSEEKLVEGSVDRMNCNSRKFHAGKANLLPQLELGKIAPTILERIIEQDSFIRLEPPAREKLKTSKSSCDIRRDTSVNFIRRLIRRKRTKSTSSLIDKAYSTPQKDSSHLNRTSKMDYDDSLKANKEREVEYSSGGSENGNSSYENADSSCRSTQSILQVDGSQTPGEEHSQEPDSSNLKSQSQPSNDPKLVAQNLFTEMHSTVSQIAALFSQLATLSSTGSEKNACESSHSINLGEESSFGLNPSGCRSFLQPQPGEDLASTLNSITSAIQLNTKIQEEISSMMKFFGERLNWLIEIQRSPSAESLTTKSTEGHCLGRRPMEFYESTNTWPLEGGLTQMFAPGLLGNHSETALSETATSCSVSGRDLHLDNNIKAHTHEILTKKLASFEDVKSCSSPINLSSGNSKPASSSTESCLKAKHSMKKRRKPRGKFTIDRCFRKCHTHTEQRFPSCSRLKLESFPKPLEVQEDSAITEFAYESLSCDHAEPTYANSDPSESFKVKKPKRKKHACTVS